MRCYACHESAEMVGGLGLEPGEEVVCLACFAELMDFLIDYLDPASGAW